MTARQWMLLDAMNLLLPLLDRRQHRRLFRWFAREYWREEAE